MSLVLVLLPPSAAIAQAADRQDAVVRALQTGDYAAAAAAADAALASHPKDCRLLTMRGLALRGEGQLDGALRSFHQALGICPDFVPALEGAAQIEYKRHSSQAGPLLEEIARLKPRDPTAHAMLAVLDWRHGDCAGALPHFEKSLALIGNNLEAQREYAACLLAEGDFQKSIDVYRQLLSRSDEPSTRLQLAVALWKAKQSVAALAALSPLIESASQHAKALALAAKIAEEKGDTPRAVAWLRRAILADPVSVSNYVLFASFALNHSSYQVGIDMIDAGLKVLPEAAPLYLARGVLRVQLAQPDAALDDFRRAHRLDPHLSFAEDAVGMVHSQQHESDASLAIFRRQARENPNDPLVQYLYAEALSAQPGKGAPADPGEAIRAARRAVELEPEYQPARDLLAVLYLRANDPAAAQREALEALKRDPSDQTALYQEIMADRRLGRAQEIGPLVARLRQLKKSEQETKTTYQLEEASTSTTTPQQEQQ
ncbi:MAG TPA: tetratricopeptide repeat protein [Acidobacteriaceae bacterium]|nr:tetratricopeptide repeat protein [Acidobacteriaceae bacterium]